MPAPFGKVLMCLGDPATPAGEGSSGPDKLRFAILAGHDSQERMAWQDGQDGRLERFMQEITVEVVSAAEIAYRERCVRGFEWRIRRKEQLEEDAHDYQLQLEWEERERQQRLKQARIDRLLDDAASLRRATDIRAYVDAVNAAVDDGWRKGCSSRRWTALG